VSAVETVNLEGRTVSLILRHGIESHGATFYTEDDNSLQVGLLQHKQGTELKPHVHRESQRIIKDVQEVLHIQHGKVLVTFYGAGGSALDSRTLLQGDTILLMAGGHGFRILEDARILEIKQGPYFGVEEDKQCLNP